VINNWEYIDYTFISSWVLIIPYPDFDYHRFCKFEDNKLVRETFQKDAFEIPGCDMSYLLLKLTVPTFQDQAVNVIIPVEEDIGPAVIIKVPNHQPWRSENKSSS
jgi:hypothetical protein